MIGKVLKFIKPFLTAAFIILVLQATGLMSSVSYATQSATMLTGLLDAKIPESVTRQTDFDYNFSIKDLQGNKSPFDKFKGKVIFLNLWATWCGPCRAEMPTIQQLYSQIDKEKIEFVILSIDKDQDLPRIVKYVQNKAFTFPVYQPSGYLTRQLQVPNIPTTFIISKDGKIVDQLVGTTNFDTPKFKKFLNELIAK